MAEFLTILIIILGILYGFSRKGTENYVKILIRGLKIGLFLGLLVGIIGFLMAGLAGGIIGGIMGGLLAGFSGIILFVMSVGIITILFIIGVLIGDVLEKILR